MIEVRSVHRWFGAVHAVRGVSFRVERGEALGLLGPNGAGKTTTIRILACCLAPSKGQALIDGHDTLRASMQARRRLGYLPESAPLHLEMRVEEHLRFAAALRRVPRRRVAQAVGRALERCWLADVRRRRVGELSKGYRQRVGLACAMLHDPAALILDEPTSGLDPAQIVETRRLIRELAQDRAVILSSHILAEVEKTCDRVVVIMQGKVRGALALREPTTTNGGRCVVELQAESEVAVRRALRAEANVQIEAVEPLAERSWWRVRAAGEGPAVQERIARSCAAHGWLVRELRPEEGSLESLFMQLLEGAEASAADDRNDQGAADGEAVGEREGKDALQGAAAQEAAP